jgi:hypothetical protein
MNLVYSKYSEVHLLNTFVDFIVDEMEIIDDRVRCDLQCLSFSNMILVLGSSDSKEILNVGEISQKFFDKYGKDFGLENPLSVVDHINYGIGSVNERFNFYINLSDRGYTTKTKKETILESEFLSNGFDKYSFETDGSITLYDCSNHLLTSEYVVKTNPKFKNSNGYHGLSSKAGRIVVYYLNKIAEELIRYNISDIIQLRYNTAINLFDIVNYDDLVYSESYVRNIIEDYFDFDFESFRIKYKKEMSHSEMTFRMTHKITEDKLIKDLILV